MMTHKHKQLAKMTTMLFLVFAIAINLFAQKTPKAIFISADGIPADVIERIDPPSLKTISKQGGYARA